MSSPKELDPSGPTPSSGADSDAVTERAPAAGKSAEDRPAITALEAHQDAADAQKDSETGGSGFGYFVRVFTYNDRLGWLLNSIAFFCMIVSGTTLPLMDVVFGQFVNVFNNFVIGELSPAGYRSKIDEFARYFIYLFLGKFVLTYIWTVIINITAVRTTKELRIDFVRQLLRQEIPFFESPSSSVSSQVTTNGNLINSGISEKFGTTIQALSSFVAAFVVAFAVQWKLTLIVISIIPVNIIVTIICVILDTKCEYTMFEMYGRSGSLSEEAFSTIRTAHAFWAFPKLTRRYRDILEDASKIGSKKSPIYAVLFPTEFFCIFAGYGLAFWQGIRMYARGEIHSPGTVVTVIFAVLVAAQALTQIAPQTVALSKAAAAAADMFSIIDRKSKVDPLSGEGIKIDGLKGEIKLRNVHFAYPSRPDAPVLHGLDLDIAPGKITALVGASGSGKSTIFGLLERWYWKAGGTITLDGQPIESLDLRWLRNSMRLVQQEPTLFTGTIYQNVVDGLTGTDAANLPDEDKWRLVRDSCRAAFAHDFIEDLPHGYETTIGERGASLSGGQRQRIVIARSIISNPRVLLLDEATSALDPKAEKIVQQALNNVAKGRTMVVIAHRLSTIRDADNIVVMSKGGVIEQGTHEQLINNKGAYARLVTAQDLGHGLVESKGKDDEGDDDADDLDRPLTHLSTARSGEAAIAPVTGFVRHSMLQGLAIIVREQPGLWTAFIIMFICAFAGGATYPALAVLFSRTMEAFTTVDVSKGDFYSLMFFVVACGNLVAYAIAGWLANVISQDVTKYYRGEIFDNTLRQDMTFFDHPEHSTGALVSRLSSEPTSLQELLSMNLALMLVNIVNLLSSSILAISYGWKLGLVLVFGGLPPLVGSGYVRIRLESKFDEDSAGWFATSSGLANEAIMAIRTVSSLALEPAVVDRYRTALDGIAKHVVSSLWIKLVFYSLSQSISYLVMGLGFWYGGHLVSTGEYTTSHFYVVFVAIVFSGESAAILFQYTTSMTKATTAMNYIFSLRQNLTLGDIDGEDDGAEPEKGSSSGSSGKGTDVEVKNAGFAYPMRPRLPVLRGVSIRIPSNKMIALVGASGCGKSTMIALLERFYDPTTGEIRTDGVNIATRHRQLHRRDISLVQQEPVLYQGSIRENISLGIEDGDPDDDAITDACRQANVWDFVASLPEGLGTPCGNQGLSLSGGQRQRIAIARALIRRPRLLLLDEATSALDTESEKVVKEALDRAANGRTTVAVAHRLSTIRDADLIVVFDRGRIVQRGTHEELIAKRGLYYEMVLGQSLDREAA